MSQKSIREALEVALNTWATANSVGVAWQNVNFTPAANTNHARAYLLPAETLNPSLGDAHKRFIGIFQVSIYTQQNKGPGAAETLADSLCTTFARGESFTAEGVTVRILETPYTSPPQNDAGFYVNPVNIKYQADVY